MNRHLIVTTLLSISISAAAGCDWQGFIDDVNEHTPGPTKQTGAGTTVGTGAGGSSGGITCTGSTSADGSVCSQCVDASGVVVKDSCASTGAGGAAGSPGDASCIKIEDGGPGSCKDAGTWKMYGVAACGQQNLTLSDIGWGVACGDGSYQNVTYACCGSSGGGAGGSGGSLTCSAVTNADGSVCKQCVDASGMIVQQDCSPPPPPGGSGGSSGSTGGGTCTKIQDGGPTSCKDTATWMKYGATACAQQNLMLTDIAWDVACPGYDGHYQSVTYVCCGG